MNSLLTLIKPTIRIVLTTKNTLAPIVPRENYLALEIRAGVKRFKAH